MDPRMMGLMGLGSGMLQASGYSAKPRSFGEIMGAGIESGMQGYQQGLGNQFMKRQMGMAESREDLQRQQLEMQRRQMENKMRQQDQLSQMFGMGAQAQPQIQPPIQPGFTERPRTPEELQQMGGVSMQPEIPKIQPQQPGGFPLNLNQAAYMKAIGGPDLLNELKYSQTGAERKAGSYYTDPSTGQQQYMPRVPEGATMSGNQMTPIPGAAGVNAAYRGAEAGAVEAAKARLDPVTIFDPRTQQNVMVPRTQAVGGGAPRLPQPGQQPFSSGAGQPEQVIASQRPSDVLYGTEMAKEAAKDYTTLQQVGAAAPGKIAEFQKVGQLLEGIRGGNLAGVKQSVASLAHNFGLDIDPRLGDKEAAEALVIKLATGMREAGTGVMTDKDFDNFLATTPQLEKTEAGRKTIIDVATKKLTRDMDIADRARKWQQKFGRIDSVNPATGMDFRSSLNVWLSENPVYGQ